MVLKIISNFINTLKGKQKKMEVVTKEKEATEDQDKNIDPHQEMIERQEKLYNQLNNNLSDNDKEKLLSAINNLSNVLKPSETSASNKNKSSGLNR